MQQCLQPREGIVAMKSQMKKSVRAVINTAYVIGLAVLLMSCAQTTSETDSQGVDDQQLGTSSVNVFPDGFFSAGYVEKYSITGIDDRGTDYTGTFLTTTGAEEVFNGVSAVPVISTLSYTTVINGVQVPPITIVLTEYFSTSIPRQYLGSVNASTSLILNAQDPVVYIPEAVVPDASGDVVSSIGSDSSIEDIDWFMQGNADGTYDLSFVYNHTDSAGGLINHEVHTYVLNESGDRLSWSLTAQISSLNNTLRFSGIRI